MPIHMWGDEDFDWQGLRECMNQIYKISRRLSGLRPMMKEKYGTIRYEFLSCWRWSKISLLKKYQAFIFRCAVRWVVATHLHLCDEILEDVSISGLFNEDKLENKYWKRSDE